MAKHKRNEKERNKELKKEVKQVKANPSAIKQLRESKGLSKYKLSVLCGMNEKTISYIEKMEDLSTVRLGTLEKVASALDLIPLDFFKKLYEKGEINDKS